MPELAVIDPLDALQAFPIENATVTLWTFKKSQKPGEQVPTFTGRWVETTTEVDTALKAVVNGERQRITETHEYGLLAQNNEASALTISTIETHAGLVISQASGELPERKITKVKHIENAVFYAIKIVANDKAIYAVTKTDTSWKTRSVKNAISVFFSDDQLGISDDRSFRLSKHVDFFIVEDKILISHKMNFESVLSYKQLHKEDFTELQAEPDFAGIFSDMTVIASYVGDNKMHLRRVSSIKQKGHYKNALFMSNLKDNHTSYGLTINFDANGKIVPCKDTCKDIFVSLLDHRLVSPFNPTNIYDVQNTDKVDV